MFIPFPLPMTKVLTLSLINPVDDYHSIPMMAIEWFLELIMRVVFLILAIVIIMEFPLWVALAVIIGILLFGIPVFVVWISRGASHKVSRLISNRAQAVFLGFCYLILHQKG